MLIRAWWLYETPSYVGCPIKHYLSDHAFSLMVVAVFNLYHSLISCPFQALGIFLAMYSEYDGGTKAISLQGLVPFDPMTNQPALLPVRSHHLVNEGLLEKFRNLLFANQDMVDMLGKQELANERLRCELREARAELNKWRRAFSTLPADRFDRYSQRVHDQSNNHW